MTRVALAFDKIREDTVGIYFERACQTLGIHFDHFWTRNASAIPLGYDLYLRIDHGDYQDDLPTHLHPKVFYATDTHLPKSWRRIRRVANRYDLMCCAHRPAAGLLPNGAWVPVACDPDLHSSAPADEKRWDVAFVGTEGGVPRKFYLQALRERYPQSLIGHAAHTELGAIYSRAKMGFNYSIRDDINMRMFEIWCAGTLLVTNQLPHDDLARLGFFERTHYVAYRNPKELFEMIDYYLRHESEREAIAMQGHRHALRAHTYAHRLRQILALTSQRTSGAISMPRMEGVACASS